MDDKPHIAVTVGDPAGIGPDIALALLSQPFDAQLTLLCPEQLLEQRAAHLAGHLERAANIADIRFEPIRIETPIIPGEPDPSHAEFIISALDTAVDGCLQGRFDAMVTGPLSKHYVNEGHPKFSKQRNFTGHTEYLADLCNQHPSNAAQSSPVMMLLNDKFRVALTTTHLPLKDVATAINQSLLQHTIQVLLDDLKNRFGIQQPHISVAGLNPHAGEQGDLGREEIETIAPVIESFQASGHHVSGPWSADTLFRQETIAETDVFLAMYHDQGLPVLKYAGFGDTVNVTLGLPIIRTSVDHGTAFNLAGTGRADASSFIKAIRTAITMIRVTQKSSG